MPIEFRQGSMPLLISIPHNGSFIPPDIAATMTEAGRSSRDTDWFLDRLYGLPATNNASWIIAQQSRYVIDLNRPSSGESLYPGQTTTGLVPTECFDGSLIYQDQEPDAHEIQRRVETVWRPYHAKLASELKRMVEEFGKAVLIEAHSIKSVVPRLFEGTLPDFNIGTNRGTSCDASLEEVIMTVLKDQQAYSHVNNGRFVGGFITRHFGQPSQHMHAVQIELSQAAYLNETDFSWNDAKANDVQNIFQELLSAVVDWSQRA
ncbi:MAG: N-formylglutamate deformylase [Pirellulaceae bacterium]